MAIQKQVGAFTDARPSGADLRGKEYYLASRDASGNFVLAVADGIVAGVIQEGKNTTYWSTVMTGGIAKVVAGGAVTPGQRMKAGAGGACVAGTTNSFGVSRNACFSGEMCEVVMDQT